MSISETRKSRFKKLVDDLFLGNQNEAARKLEIKPPQINRWLSDKNSDPRSISEISARKIEQKLNLPDGWLDGRTISAIINSASALTAEQKTAIYEVGQLEPVIRDVVDLMREMSAQTQREVFKYAEFLHHKK